MKKLALNVFSTVAALSLAVSCGNDSSNGGSGSGGRQAQEIAPVDGSNIDGHYQAQFTTLNPHVNGTIPGSANFFRKDDKMFAYVRLFAGGVRAWHMQNVYTGGRCPTLKDDTNGDGFVDIQEAEAVLGKILIPLDSNISSQKAGNRFFPLADLSGYYHYERITNFRSFLRDLQEEDKDLDDNMTKLGPDEGLRLVGKTVLIQGVVETVDLPDTVASQGRRRAFQTLPIVCGVFQKKEGMPGTTYVQDEIPGPVAEVVEGQDHPADEPIPETTGGSTGSGSGTNDSDDGDGPVSDGDHGSTSGGSSTGSSTTGGSSTGSSTTGGSTSGSSTTGGSTTGSSTTGGSTTGSSTTGSSTTGGSTTGGSTTGSSTTGSSTTGGSTTGDTTTGGTTGSTTDSTSTTGSTTGGSFGF